MVTSEVSLHLGGGGGGIADEEELISSFAFTVPSWMRRKTGEESTADDVMVDGDGDLEVPRNSSPLYDDCVLIEHRLHSTLAEVGTQVWRGAFFLADFLLGNRHTVAGKTVLEVGAGTGLVSIVTSLCGATRVLATDLPENLARLEGNVERNRALLTKREGCDVSCLSLNLKEPLISFDWSQVEVVIGADVVYDEAVSLGILRTLRELVFRYPRRRRLALFAVEKRYVFTLSDLATVAPAFDFFLGGLRRMLAEPEWGSHETKISELLGCSEEQEQYFCYETSKDMVLISVEVRDKSVL